VKRERKQERAMFLLALCSGLSESQPAASALRAPIGLASGSDQRTVLRIDRRACKSARTRENCTSEFGKHFCRSQKFKSKLVGKRFGKIIENDISE
jgi:hypothetical protein